LNGEKTNVLRTISVLVFEVLKWLEFPSCHIYTCPSSVYTECLKKMYTHYNMEY
jgi:hypothetical protein